jgi:ferredoxin
MQNLNRKYNETIEKVTFCDLLFQKQALRPDRVPCFVTGRVTLPALRHLASAGIQPHRQQPVTGGRYLLTLVRELIRLGARFTGGPVPAFIHVSAEVAVYSKILILRFPKTEVKKPIVCYLARDYDLTFNILNATILPRKEGILVLELHGARKNFKQGVSYLKSQGVQVKSASQEIKRNKQRCTHCGACTAVCPTGALAVTRPEMRVDFKQKACSVCELCVAACPSRAMVATPVNQSFFL